MRNHTEVPHETSEYIVRTLDDGARSVVGGDVACARLLRTKSAADGA